MIPNFSAVPNKMGGWSGGRMRVARFLCLLLGCCHYVATALKERSLREVTDEKALHYLAEELADMNGFKQDQLKPILIERISDTPNNKKVREHIIKQMENLGWVVEKDSFADNTPFGRKNFVNVIATFNPGHPQRTVVACHYDSKDMQTEKRMTFMGATDSAVPCAIMLETAKQLDCLLTKSKGRKENAVAPSLTLQYVFFDGEEAFKRWSDQDSIYGARHLAKIWEENTLPSIREFILLDLIGTSDTQFKKLFDSTSVLYDYLVETEKKLRSNNLLTDGHTATIFKDVKIPAGIEDDHIPFVRKGVDILHLISVPFPSVWHKVQDDEQHLDYAFINNFSRIFRVFMSGLMHLEPENIGCRK